MENTYYEHRGRRWCSGSNTVPSTSERDQALENGRKFECSYCGRDVTMTKTGLVPAHLHTTAAKVLQGGRR